jgi:N-acyl-D-aspartate/D-glutamate deacylase
MQKPEYLEALRHDYDHGRTPFVGGHVGTYTLDEVFLPEHKQYEGKTVAELGEMQGRHPIDALVELVCKEDLKTIMFTPPFNIREDLQGDLMSSEYTIPGVSDGGAHTKFITIGRYPTDFLANYTRDLGYISLEEAHYRLSAQPARCAGFDDRGTLEVGMPADIVVYDYENLAITPKDKPVVVNDFPGGEWRYVQYAEGYRWILVNGEVTFKDGECTGALAGQLLRHGSGKGAGQRKAG